MKYRDLRIYWRLAHLYEPTGKDYRSRLTVQRPFSEHGHTRILLDCFALPPLAEDQPLDEVAIEADRSISDDGSAANPQRSR